MSCKTSDQVTGHQDEGIVGGHGQQLQIGTKVFVSGNYQAPGSNLRRPTSFQQHRSCVSTFETSHRHYRNLRSLKFCCHRNDAGGLRFKSQGSSSGESVSTTLVASVNSCELQPHFSQETSTCLHAFESHSMSPSSDLQQLATSRYGIFLCQCHILPTTPDLANKISYIPLAAKRHNDDIDSDA